MAGESIRAMNACVAPFNWKHCHRHGTTTGLRGDPDVWRLGAPDQELTAATAGSTPHVDPGGREAREGVVLVNVLK